MTVGLRRVECGLKGIGCFINKGRSLKMNGWFEDIGGKMRIRERKWDDCSQKQKDETRAFRQRFDGCVLVSKEQIVQKVKLIRWRKYGRMRIIDLDRARKFVGSKWDKEILVEDISRQTTWKFKWEKDNSSPQGPISLRAAEELCRRAVSRTKCHVLCR